jgi:hypothetical protein
VRKRWSVCSFLLFFPLFLLSAQEDFFSTRIGVLAPVNTTEDERLEVLSDTMADTISLSLKLMKAYTVVDLEKADTVPDFEGLYTIARRNRVDKIIFGETTQNDEGTIIFTLSIYDIIDDTIVATDVEQAEKMLETFEAADKAVAGVLESVSAQYIAFGEIALKNRGSTGIFEVFIDGISVGRNPESVPNVLEGKRTVTITQTRPFGDYLVHEETVRVQENRSNTVVFSVPGLTEEETTSFEALKRSLIVSWHWDNRQVERLFYTADLLFEDAEASDALLERRETFQRWKTAYETGEVPGDLASAIAQADRERGKKVPKTIDSPALGYITGIAGTLFMAGGGLTHIMGVEALSRSMYAWDDYYAAGDNFEELYGTYQEESGFAQIMALSSYGAWGLGATSLAFSTFLFPDKGLKLSIAGQIGINISLALAAAGGFFVHTSNRTLFDSRRNWLEYYAAGEESASNLYSDYEDAMLRYTIFRIAGYALWGAAAVAVPVSLILPGKREPVYSTLFDKILVSAGLAMITGGNFCLSFAQNFRVQSEQAWEDYITGGDNLDELYDLYEEPYDNYVLTTILSYSLWGAGGAAILAATLIPFEKDDGAEQDDITGDGSGSRTAGKKSPDIMVYPIADGVRAGAGVYIRF